MAKISIRQADLDHFELGKNIATTPGKVVFRNDLFELIQYDPVTDEVAETPLLIIPPWINKFYILDLQPQNSFIKWATEQGRTVFVISWVNPGPALKEKTFEDYIKDGPVFRIGCCERGNWRNESRYDRVLHRRNNAIDWPRPDGKTR